MKITFETTYQEGLDPKAALGMRFVGLTMAMVECMKEMGLSKEEAMERAPAVIEAAWESKKS
nr:hypothetical protein 41 [Balneolaceae bacterium]